MRNHNILRHHSQHLTQKSKIKVTEPKTAENVIFDGRYPLISSFTRGVMLRHDRTEGWLEILGAVSSDP